MSTPPVSTLNINTHLRRYKSGTGSNPNNLGGVISVHEISDLNVNNLFPKVTEAETVTGITKYRCNYFKNIHSSESMKNFVLFFSKPVTSSSIKMSLGIGTLGVKNTGSEPTIANQNTAPTGVSFLDEPHDRTTALSIPEELPPGYYVPIWFKMFVEAGTTPAEFVHYWLEAQIFNNAAVNNIPEKFSFAIVSNMDCSSRAKRTVRRAFNRGVQNIVTAGNNTDQPTADCWLDGVIGPYASKTVPTFGRHEFNNPTVKNQIATYFGRGSRRRWVFSYFNVRFIIIDFQNAYVNALDDPNYDWLVRSLSRAAFDEAIDYIIVVANDAAFLSNSAYDRDIESTYRDAYVPLFNKYGVHLVISASAPRYERQGLLKWVPATPDSPTLMQEDQHPNYTFHEHTFIDNAAMYVNVGPAGQEEIDEDSMKPYTKSAVSKIGAGYLLLDFLEFGKKLQGRYYDDGDVLKDNFSMKKTLPPAPPP